MQKNSTMTWKRIGKTFAKFFTIDNVTSDFVTKWGKCKKQIKSFGAKNYVCMKWAKQRQVTSLLTVCLYVHVTHVFQSEFTLYSCLNIKELLARTRCDIWQIDELFSVFRDLTGSFLERNWKLHLSSVRRVKSIFFSFSLYKLYSTETSLLWRLSQRFLRFTINL